MFLLLISFLSRLYLGFFELYSLLEDSKLFVLLSTLEFADSAGSLFQENFTDILEILVRFWIDSYLLLENDPQGMKIAFEWRHIVVCIAVQFGFEIIDWVFTKILEFTLILFWIKEKIYFVKNRYKWKDKVEFEEYKREWKEVLSISYG